MPIKITINCHEIKNPIIKILISLVGLLIFFVVLVFLLLFILPFIWVVVISIMFLVITLAATGPKLLSKYKIIIIENKAHKHAD